MTWHSPKRIIDDIVSVQWWLEGFIAKSRDGAFWPISWIKTGDDRPKPLAPVDLMAERKFEEAMYGPSGSAATLNFLGEERLHSETDLTNESRPCCLVDMIDGTDLLQRGFGNWCSAVLLFDPVQKVIEASFVVIPNSRAYYATKDGAFAFDLVPQEDAQPKVVGPQKQLQLLDRDRTLKDATLRMYTQKIGNLSTLLSLHTEAEFRQWAERQLAASKDAAFHNVELAFRFYNLAGNPMMARMSEGRVDIVTDIAGQHPHDTVPGAFIALKAGASLALL